MIEESYTHELIPCYVKEIITSDPRHESGIKVSCENGKIGRVKYIGTESTCKKPLELVIILEKRLRKLIVDVLSNHDEDWWNNNIPSLIRKAVEEKQNRNTKQKRELEVPEYEKIEETDFFHLHLIIGYKKNWRSFFEPVFVDKSETTKKLVDLATYRNLPAHGKDLTVTIERKIQDYFDDLILQVEDYYRKRNESPEKNS